MSVNPAGGGLHVFFLFHEYMQTSLCVEVYEMVEKKKNSGSYWELLTGSSVDHLQLLACVFFWGRRHSFVGSLRPIRQKRSHFLLLLFFFLLCHCGDGTSFWMRAEERIEKTENLQERTSFFYYYYYLSCSTVPVKVA